MAAIKESKQIRYDAIPRGSTYFIPYFVLRQNSDAQDPTGNIKEWEPDKEYNTGDIIHVTLQSYDFYFRATETVPATKIFSLAGNFWEPVGKNAPYDLSGNILLLTAKKESHDGLEETRNKKPTTYWKQLRDVSAENGMDDAIFRITIDCDNKTAGEIAPLWVNEGAGFIEVFHGMYGADPTLGEATFRIPKKATFVDPGSYYFDIRIMKKQSQQIGYQAENPVYLQAFGYLDIYGTPTNRSTAFNPFIYPESDDIWGNF